MKTKLSMLLVALATTFHFASAIDILSPAAVEMEEMTATSPKEDPPKEDSVLIFAEIMPSFPGGQKELYKFLAENMKYPEKALEEGAQGRVVIRFMVDSSGEIRNLEIVKSSGNEDLDAEAFRLVSVMPDWQPGMQDGKPVTVFFSLPVVFKINDNSKPKTKGAPVKHRKGY